MNEQLITEISNQLEPQLFILLLKALAIGVIVLILKGLAERAAAYLLFRWDKDLGVGVRVFVRGQEGIIKNFNLSCIYVKCNDRIIIIRMRRWLYEKIDLVKDNVGDRELKPDK